MTSLSIAVTLQIVETKKIFYGQLNIWFRITRVPGTNVGSCKLMINVHKEPS